MRLSEAQKKILLMISRDNELREAFDNYEFDIIYEHFTPSLVKNSHMRGMKNIVLQAEFTKILNNMGINPLKYVWRIWPYMYYMCNIKTIEFVNAVQAIDSWAFTFCRSLNDISMPNSITTIGENVFVQCNKFTNITLPQNLVTLGNAAFSNCENLSTIEMFNNIKNIDKHAFKDNPKLRDIIYHGTMTEFKNINIIGGTLSNYGVNSQCLNTTMCIHCDDGNINIKSI